MDDADETSKPHDLRERLKAFAQPFVDSLDTKLRDQVDERVDATLSARLAVIERAIADLDRAVKALEARLG